MACSTENVPVRINLIAPPLYVITTSTPEKAKGLEILNKACKAIGKKHALKKYDQFALKTSCFSGSTGSNITLVVQFHEIFVTKIMNKSIYYYC